MRGWFTQQAYLAQAQEPGVSGARRAFTCIMSLEETDTDHKEMQTDHKERQHNHKRHKTTTEGHKRPQTDRKWPRETKWLQGDIKETRKRHKPTTRDTNWLQRNTKQPQRDKITKRGKTTTKRHKTGGRVCVCVPLCVCLSMNLCLPFFFFLSLFIWVLLTELLPGQLILMLTLVDIGDCFSFSSALQQARHQAATLCWVLLVQVMVLFRPADMA